MLIKDFQETDNYHWEYLRSFNNHQYFYYSTRDSIVVVDSNLGIVENPCTADVATVYLVDRGRHIRVFYNKIFFPVCPLFYKNSSYLEISSLTEVFWLGSLSNNSVEIEYPEELRANFKIVCTSTFEYKFRRD